jgi:hypothetical protein
MEQLLVKKCSTAKNQPYKGQNTCNLPSFRIQRNYETEIPCLKGE